MNKENLEMMYDEANAACSYYTKEWLDGDSSRDELDKWEARLELLEALLATF